MKVAMLVSNAFTSDPRVYNEATSLLGAGHEVTVIAWDAERQNPSSEDRDGLHVLRVRTRLAPQHGFASWLWNGFRLLAWQRQAYRRALLLNKEGRVDVIHCHDFDTLAIGTRLKRKLKIPLVYDAHEIYGYMMARTFPLRIARIFLWLERRLLRRVDRVITDGEGRQTYFAGITDRPITTIMNCKLLQETKYRPPADDIFTVLYIGTLWMSRLLLELVEAVKGLPRVRCLIGGIGPPTYVQALEEACAKTSNATFLGRVPFNEVIPMTKEAHVVACLIDPDDLNNRLGMANKIGEAMVCGRPVICTKDTYSGEITEREQCGLVIEQSVEALREAIIKLRDDPAFRERLGRNALAAAVREYNWQRQEERLLELYEGLGR